MSQFDITRHIDYENHMKDYVKKVEAKQIIENIKKQVGYRPIQQHPDYPALMNMLKDQHRAEMSKLEQEMKRKTQAPGSINEITLHPDYKTVTRKYDNEIRRLNSQISLLQARRPIECPAVPACPVCPKCSRKSPAPETADVKLQEDYSMRGNLIINTPIASNNYPPLEVPSAPSWSGLFGGGWSRKP